MDWGQRIGRRLKLRDLHILFAVVECGSMTRAAKQLSVSNPVVSKAIAGLEHTLGVRLLDRDVQGIHPTIHGRALLDRGLAAFDELRQAVKVIEALSDPTVGEVRIGSSVAIASGFIPAVVARLNRRFPRIVVDWTIALFFRNDVAKLDLFGEPHPALPKESPSTQSL